MNGAGGSVSGNPAVGRIVEHALGVDAADALREGLAGSDLTSLLLDVMNRRASLRSASDVIRQYETDRFTRPAQVDPRTLLSVCSRAVESLMPEFELVETAPLVPLGTHSVVAGISQNRVVSTIRSTELAADPTNSLALEAAARRRRFLHRDPKSTELVQLASIDRVVRAQRFDGPRSFAHFTLLGLVTAGRDIGNRRFDIEALVRHLEALRAACRVVGFPDVLVQLTDFGGGNGTTIDACAAALRHEVSVELWPERPAGRGYYESVCFKLSVMNDDEIVEVADGGLVNWTQQLLDNRKERLMISGLSLERLTHLATPGSE